MTTPYSERPFHHRFGQLGDQAEQAYAERCPHGPFVRFGWRRPEVSMSKMSPMLRYMPDFYTADGHLVEIMGCGKDGILKGLKRTKWEAMLEWDRVQPLWFWLWNSHLSEGYTITVVNMTIFAMDSIQRFGVKSFGIDQNQYYPIPWEWIKPVGEYWDSLDRKGP
jgi:hypothetical protein